MLKLKIGPVILGQNPRIVAVIDRNATPAFLRSLKTAGATLLEFRFDLIPDFEKALELADKARTLGFGIIGTLRENESNKRCRDRRYLKIKPMVHAVDIEVNEKGARRTAQFFRNKTVIVSHHDFEAMPSLDALLSLADQCAKSGADIVKLACMAHTHEEAERMLVFVRECRHPVIAFAMGKTGAYTRMESLKAGSLATYAFTGKKAVAPGQFSVKALASRLPAKGR